MRSFEEMSRYVRQTDAHPPSEPEVRRVLREILLFGESMALRAKRLRLWAAPVRPSTVFAVLAALDKLEVDTKAMLWEMDFSPRDEEDHR